MTSHVPPSRPSGVRLKDSNARSTREVLIIGAGPGGLAAAMLLAHAGLSVRIVERMPRVGGRTSALEGGGFRFDLGPTFFLYPAVLRRIFESVGRRLDDEVELVKVDPQYRIHFGNDTELLCRADVAHMEREVARLSPEDATQIRAFMADAARKFEAMRPVMEREARGWRDFATLLKLVKVLRPWNSLDDDLRRFFKDERVRRAFSFQAKYLGMSPFNCPSLFSIISFLEYDAGVYHPIGGCAAVTEAMARVARQMGVKIHLGEDVTGILFEGRKAVGVRTTEGEYRADALVINADFARAMQRLVPNELRRDWSNENLEKKKYSCSTFMMYLGIDGRYDDLAHHTIYIPDDYKVNLRDIGEDHVLSQHPSMYVQNASVTDSTLAPPGMSTLYVLVPTPHHTPNVDWGRERSRYRALVMRELGKIGLGDVEKRVRYERIVTPEDWRAGHQIYNGAVFNLAHTMSQLLSNRPKNKFDELEQVYLVGGGTHPGSGLPVIFESARISARLLLTEMGMDTAWMERAADPMVAALGGAREVA
jgi:phytoene desaturase